MLFENITMVVLILSFTSREFNIMGCSKVDNEITDFYTRIYQPLEFLHIKNIFRCFINWMFFIIMNFPNLRFITWKIRLVLICFSDQIFLKKVYDSLIIISTDVAIQNIYVFLELKDYNWNQEGQFDANKNHTFFWI